MLRSKTLLADYQRALSLRQMVREFALTRESAPDIVAEAERRHGSIQVRNESEGSAGELVLEGPVWPSDWAYEGEISPANVRKALNELGDAEEVRVYINSPGGEPFAGHAIYSMFKRHAAKVIVHIDGIAASAASLIAVGADELVVSLNSTFMIHSAATLMLGWFNSADLQKESGVLDQIDKSIIAAYAMKSGRDEDELRSMVVDETWLVGEEIVNEGFADTLTGDDKPKKSQVVASFEGPLVTDDDIKKAIKKAGDAIDAVMEGGDDPPDDSENEADEEKERKLKMLALELELLSSEALF